jgi:hypothetical protein
MNKPHHRFAFSLPELIRTTGTRVTVADFDSMPELAWRFLSLNKDFLQLLGMKEEYPKPQKSRR